MLFRKFIKNNNSRSRGITSRALGVAFALSCIPTASAQPPQAVIEQCMKAADFEGCVNVMTGKPKQSTQPTETKITVDLDKIRNTGNFCPSQYAYIGGGYCQEWLCYNSYGSHDPRLGGKGNSCKGGWIMRFTDKPPIRATTDERCPLTEPEVGKRASCLNGLSESEIKAGIYVSRRPASSYVGFGISLEKDDFSGDEFPTKVSSVMAGSSAEKAGLIEGDILKTINGVDYKDKPSLSPGQTYSLLVERDSSLFEISIKAEQINTQEGLVKVKSGEVIEVIK